MHKPASAVHQPSAPPKVGFLGGIAKEIAGTFFSSSLPMSPVLGALILIIAEMAVFRGRFLSPVLAALLLATLLLASRAGRLADRARPRGAWGRPETWTPADPAAVTNAARFRLGYLLLSAVAIALGILLSPTLESGRSEHVRDEAVDRALDHARYDLAVPAQVHSKELVRSPETRTIVTYDIAGCPFVHWEPVSFAWDLHPGQPTSLSMHIRTDMQAYYRGDAVADCTAHALVAAGVTHADVIRHFEHVASRAASAYESALTLAIFPLVMLWIPGYLVALLSNFGILASSRRNGMGRPHAE